VNQYRSTHGQALPPFDAWAIDIYPIDWLNTPNASTSSTKWPLYNGVRTKHSTIAIEQVLKMRDYLNTLGLSSKPIWITEIAIHVGYDGWTRISATEPDVFRGTGKYNWNLMSNYIHEVLDWLELYSSSKNIERWYFYISHSDIVGGQADGYLGPVFFNGPDPGAAMTCIGQAYRSRVMMEPRLRCDAAGNTINAAGQIVSLKPTGGIGVP